MRSWPLPKKKRHSERPVRVHAHVNLVELAKKMWWGNRLIVKQLNTDKRVRFGIWKPKQAPADDPNLEEGESLVTAPGGTTAFEARRYAVVFRLLDIVQPWAGRLKAGMAQYLVKHVHPQSAIIADSMHIEVSDGEVRFKSCTQPEE